MGLFPKIDRGVTKLNVDRLLSEYRTMERLADEEYAPKITATYSLVLKAPGDVSDNVSKTVTRKVVAERELWKIGRALNKLNAYSRQLLHERYISKKKKSDIEIYTDLNVSETTFYKELSEAMIEFAEAYDGGRLLAEVEEK